MERQVGCTVTLYKVVCSTIQNKLHNTHKRNDPYPAHYHVVRLRKISHHDTISLPKAHFSFGASRIQWLKGLEDDACDSVGFE
jgi:hypothetical protein